MTCIRYEFDKIGLFSAVDMLESVKMTWEEEMEYKRVMQEFADDLDEPPILKTGNCRDGISLFTLVGDRAFANELESLTDLFEEYLVNAGMGELDVIELDVPDGEILYRDDYQVVIHRDAYERLISEQYSISDVLPGDDESR